ncbi:hypothetical protein MCEPAE42_00478 [Candidatus Nanopelagicaceae bacterium]
MANAQELKGEQDLAGVFNRKVELKRFKQGFFRLIRIYPFIAVGLLLVIYLLGGFNQKSTPLIPREILNTLLYGLVTVIPLLAILIFIGLSISEDRSRGQTQRKTNNFAAEDPFDLTEEKMCGFKVAALSGVNPTFTGITGNTYSNDENAICEAFPEHIPPANGCECGFYAYKSVRDAQFELSIHPGLFLIQVDLFGIGFSHRYGYRAESQRVNSLKFPKRCMRCKILPARGFVKTYKLGYSDNTWWQWSARCSICASAIKDKDKLTIEQMSHQLQVVIN